MTLKIAPNKCLKIFFLNYLNRAKVINAFTLTLMHSD